MLEQKIGNTVVRFHDDYCKDKTENDIKAILSRIAMRAQAEFTAAIEKDI